MPSATPAAASDAARLALALRMADHGLPVFPLRPGTKLPYAEEGVRVATCDAEQIEHWFAERPGMNYGLACDDHPALDVDVKHGAPGAASLATLRERVELPDTLMVRTPSGGEHYVLAGMTVGQTPVADGIDVRGRGGYVVGAGSVLDHRAGPGNVPGVYELAHDVPPAPVPASLARAFQAASARYGQVQELAGVELDTSEACERARRYLAEQTGVPRGSRNAVAYRHAAAVREYGATIETTAALLSEWNVRNVPPLPLSELGSVAAHAARYARRPAGVRLAAVDFGDLAPVLAEMGTPDKRPATAGGTLRPIELIADPARHPRRPWLVYDFLLRGHLTALVSQGGVGKSTAALAVAAGCVLKDLSSLGLHLAPTPGDLHVVVLSAEDDEQEMQTRLWAFCAHHGLPYQQLAGRIHFWDGGPQLAAFRFAERNAATRQLAATAMVASLRAYAKQHNAALIVADPLIEMHDGDENSNQDVAVVGRIFRTACRELHAAGLVVHHISKAAATGGSTDPDTSARGASALINMCRLAYKLTRMSEDIAGGLCMPASEAARYIRLDKGKGNYSPPGPHTKWYRLVSLDMGNGDLDTGEPATQAATLESVSLDALDAAARDRLHAAVLAMIESRGEVAMGDAVTTLRETLLRDLSEVAIRERIETAFRDGHLHDNISIRIKVTGADTARPRRHLVIG